MSHYFKFDENVKSHEKKMDIKIDNIPFSFYTDHGVFSKKTLDFGTRLMLENVLIKPKCKKAIDMGCGWGPIAIYLKKKHPNLLVEACDINERAVLLTKKNAKLNDVEIDVYLSDLFEEVKNKVDLVITNPPIRAGKEKVFKLYEEAFNHLNPGGELYSVVRVKQGAKSHERKLFEIFDNCTIIAKKKGYSVFISKKHK